MCHTSRLGFLNSEKASPCRSIMFLPPAGTPDLCPEQVCAGQYPVGWRVTSSQRDPHQSPVPRGTMQSLRSPHPDASCYGPDEHTAPAESRTHPARSCIMERLDACPAIPRARNESRFSGTAGLRSARWHENFDSTFYLAINHRA